MSQREFGVVEFDSNGKVLSLEEKPKSLISNYVIPRLYFYDNDVIEIVKNVKPYLRGEIEITFINNEYLRRGKLYVTLMCRGMTQSVEEKCNFKQYSFKRGVQYLKKLQVLDDDNNPRVEEVKKYIDLPNIIIYIKTGYIFSNSSKIINNLIKNAE